MLKNTYELKIEDLKINSCQGVLESEKLKPQEFILNINVCSLFPYQDAKEDIFNKINCYGNIREVVHAVFQDKVHNTLETIANSIIDKIFLVNSNFYKVSLEIKKTQIYSDCIVGIKIVREKGWHDIYLSFGSNMGDKKNNILNAYKSLESEGIVIDKKSNIIETLPMYDINQDNFYNSVARCRTFLSPDELLSTIEKIMTSLGRVRAEKNGPRKIDIDILFYEDINLETDSLTIPHPKIKERDFVLSGLKELGFEFL